jgi:hypothetical protein
MRFRVEIGRETLPQGFNLLIWKSCRLSFERNQVCHTRDLQYLQAFLQRKLHKDIAWKEWKVHFSYAIFPPMLGSVKRQETDDTLAR